MAELEAAVDVKGGAEGPGPGMPAVHQLHGAAAEAEDLNLKEASREAPERAAPEPCEGAAPKGSEGAATEEAQGAPEPLHPWEQHGQSIQMARFDYAVQNRILGTSAGDQKPGPGPSSSHCFGVQGFLITSPFSTYARKKEQKSTATCYSTSQY